MQQTEYPAKGGNKTMICINFATQSNTELYASHAPAMVWLFLACLYLWSLNALLLKTLVVVNL